MISFNATHLSNLQRDLPATYKIGVVFALTVLSAGLSVSVSGTPPVADLLLLSAALFAVLLLVLLLRQRLQDRARRSALDMLNKFIANDSAPAFVAHSDGAIHVRNRAARDRFQAQDADTLAASLRSIFVNPSAVLLRIQAKALQDGAAREDVVTRNGHVRIGAHMLGAENFLWRIEDLTAVDTMGLHSEHAPLPMVTAGRSGTVLFMNHAARELVGHRVKALETLFRAPVVRSGQVNTLQTKGGAVEVVVWETPMSCGRRELFLIPLEQGRKARQFAEIESVPVPLLRLNREGALIVANSAARKLLGDTLERGIHLGQVLDGMGRPVQDWLRETAAQDSTQNTEFLRLKREDKDLHVQVTLSPVVTDGEVELIAVLNDATELKTLEAQFVQSQKMQAIGQLAGGIAHDFNNLLTAISGHCDLLLLRHDQGDQDYGDLVQINENANRAASLVGQLLAFSRKQTLRLEVLDLRDTLSDLTHLLNRLVGEKVSLTLSHDPVLRPIRADKRQLEQVLVNLVVNARDAMPDGGEIRIQTEILTLEQPLQRDRATVPKGEYVAVKVTDEGTGIPAEVQEKIFEPFFTTKRTGDGTGLGLSTAYGIIKQTGGFIFVDSVPGQGSQFTLFLPTCDPVEIEAPAAAPARAEPAPCRGDGVVLLVEDEAPVRAFASRALRMRGYTVLEAESAEDALKTLQDPGLNVDVFVTDVVMPGMDGPSWVREARKDRPDVAVVFISGYAEGAFGEADAHVTNSVFLPKPFSLAQLTETVGAQLN